MGPGPRLVGLLVIWGVDDGVVDSEVDAGVFLLGVWAVSFFFSASCCRSLESRRWRSLMYCVQSSGQSHESRRSLTFPASPWQRAAFLAERSYVSSAMIRWKLAKYAENSQVPCVSIVSSRSAVPWQFGLS